MAIRIIDYNNYQTCPACGCKFDYDKNGTNTQFKEYRYDYNIKWTMRVYEVFVKCPKCSWKNIVGEKEEPQD